MPDLSWRKASGIVRKVYEECTFFLRCIKSHTGDRPYSDFKQL